jgi:hypothetical protein
MWQFIKDNPFIVGALTGSLASYLLGLLVSYLRREKKILGYSRLSRKIAERGGKDLNIEYKGQQINSLYSHQVIIRNIGNRALKDVDVQIICDGGKFVDLKFDVPKGANYIPRKEDEDKKVIIKCDLINRGESFTVGLTSINSKSEDVSVVARDENLICKEIEETAKFAELLEIIANQSVASRVFYDVTRFFLK